ncbi:hypothetical protein MTO96_038470 [Rhipicephalus appendiculatus]
MTAGIHVPEEVWPRFFKHRPLPFALKDGVTQQLQRVQREVILVQVKTAKRFLPNLSAHLQPLHILLRDGQHWAWKKEQDVVLPAQPIVPLEVVPVQASPRVVRWVLKLVAYSYQLVIRPGKDLGPADALSRLPVPEVPAAVPEPAEAFMPEHAYPEILSWVLQLLHAGHPGVEKTKMVARSHVWWPGLDQDTTHMVQSCQVYQEHKRASRQVEITPWSFPQRPWSRLHADFGGPLQRTLLPGGGRRIFQSGWKFYL